MATDNYSYKGNEPFKNLRILRNKHPKNIIISCININSIKNKFTDFVTLIKDAVDVLVTAETKLDYFFFLRLHLKYQDLKHPTGSMYPRALGDF